MYTKLQILRKEHRESHAVSIPYPSSTNVGNFMVLKIPMTQSLEVSILDNASTHTILRSPIFFSFPAGNTN